MQTALEDGPDGLDIVGAHAVPNILARRMLDRLMLVEQPAYSLVAAVLIRVQRRASRHVPMDHRMQDVRAGARNGLCQGAPAALAHTDDSHLADRAATRPELLVGVLVRLFSADVGLVD